MNQETNPAMPVAVVLGMSANGLSIVRSLGRKGVKVIGIDTDLSLPAMRSRYLCEKHLCPTPESEEFIDFLIKVAKKQSGKIILFATADDYLVPLSENRELLSQYYNYLMPPSQVVADLLDKEKTALFAEKNDILHPKTRVVASKSDLVDAVDYVGLPCFFKPISSHNWKKHSSSKGFKASTLQECLDKFEQVSKLEPKILVQQIIEGGDSNLYEYLAYCDHDGNILAEFTLKSVLMYPPEFGIPCLSESVSDARLVDLGRKTAKAAQCKGLVHFEYKLDPNTNRFVFIEANLRTSFLGELSVTSGVDLPWIAYADLAFGDVPDSLPVQKNGVKLVNLDWMIGRYMRTRNSPDTKLISIFKEAISLNNAHTHFSWTDPAPWAVVYGRFLVNIFKKIVGGAKFSAGNT